MPNVFLFEDTQFFDNSGKPLIGGKIFTYAAGGTTPQAAYTDSTGNSLASNPIICDSAGRAAIWLTANSYHILITSAGGATIKDLDGVNVVPPPGTLGSLTVTGDSLLDQTVAATAGANQSSHILKIRGTVWNGAASVNDEWALQNVVGAGSNPTSTLQLAHSAGSNGAASVNVPGTLSAGIMDVSTGYRVSGAAAAHTFLKGDATNYTPGNVNLASADVTGVLPTASGGTGQNSTATFPASGNVATGAGTTGKHAKFTTGASGIIGDSAITESATAVSASLPFTLTPGKQIFTASGTFTIPSGVTAVKATLIGGGGGGGGATVANNGGGGGAGGTAIKWLTGLTPGNTIAVTVGSLGAGGVNVGGSNGTASTIASGTQTITTVTANGGAGGNCNAAQSAGGAGGAISTNGDMNFGGNPGAGCWTNISGAAGGCSMFGGAGTDSNGGNPGIAATANSGSGGGGAGSGANRTGGNGAAGIVFFEWVS